MGDRVDMVKSIWKYTATAGLIGALLTGAGCSFGAGNNESDKPQSLKVMYYNEQAFYQDFGMLFAALYPNIDLQIVSTQNMNNGNGDPNFDYNEAMQKFIDEEKPDVVLVQEDQLKKLVEQGKLYELETVMKQEKYDTETIIPGLIDYLKEMGGGQLYALTPSFYSQVLYYNKDLFDKYQIAPPTDQMGWEEVLHLAKQFPTEGEPKERIYGMKAGYSGTLSELGNMIGNTEGLRIVNASKQQMTMDSEGWKQALSLAQSALASNALYYESMEQQMENGTTYEDYLLRDPFIAGRTAMMIGDAYYLEQIKQASEYNTVKDKMVQNWDVVTTPVSIQAPDQSSNMGTYNLFAIMSESPNKDAAWQFISYITSEEYARVKSKSGYNNGLPIRSTYIKDEAGHSLDAFYKLKPVRSNSMSDYSKLPQQFWMQINGVMEQQLGQVKDGGVSIEDALAKVQLEGQQLLDRLVEEEKAAKAAKPADSAAAGSAADATPDAEASQATDVSVEE